MSEPAGSGQRSRASQPGGVREGASGRSKGRRETPEERSDRNWNELLQEFRVMQTGVQILTGFLLMLPFQQRFTALDGYQVTIYLVLVLLAVTTTVVVVAPVSVHRLLFQRRRKPETVMAGNAIAKVGLMLLGLVIVGVVLLVFDVVTSRALALAIAALVLVVQLLGWVLVPVVIARRDA